MWPVMVVIKNKNIDTIDMNKTQLHDEEIHTLHDLINITESKTWKPHQRVMLSDYNNGKREVKRDLCLSKLILCIHLWGECDPKIVEVTGV